MTPRERVTLAMALCAGAFVAFIEVHATEVSPTLGAIVVTGAILGLAAPRWFWLWALIVGGAVPLAYGIAALGAFTPRTWPEPHGVAFTYFWMTAVTVGVGLCASALGACAARWTNASRGRFGEGLPDVDGGENTRA